MNIDLDKDNFIREMLHQTMFKYKLMDTYRTRYPDAEKSKGYTRIPYLGQKGDPVRMDAVLAPDIFDHISAKKFITKSDHKLCTFELAIKGNKSNFHKENKTSVFHKTLLQNKEHLEDIHRTRQS